MNSGQIRKAFLDFFESKQHKIVPSAPMVIKNDPTLMFTNAGMNQFKDLFLGNSKIVNPRIADSQKCLRVSGKHNDLEEVGHDAYHHTMFEMLGNWSFGDYFKQDAINWAWEFLVDLLKIDKSRLYATVFEGSQEENIEPDLEAKQLWSKYLPEERILFGNKKDNFWEMGDTGPCGPCSEIHVDLRSDEDIAKIKGSELVNKDNPLVIEIWNLVFIQFNRKQDGTLHSLPSKHVDTGMGFERLCMVVQGKKSNYDTDVFQPVIKEIAKFSKITYGADKKTDIAMRVIADHLRTVSFSIADGQLPSNEKAGYVIRRILRRAIRYAYTFLGHKEAFIYRLLPVLSEVMGEAYPELISQRNIIEKVIHEEENSFLRTLEHGIKLLDEIISKTKSEKNKVVDGKTVFVLYDTFGFPYDLTDLILRENDLSINKQEFDDNLQEQQKRSRNDAKVETDDWTTISDDDKQEFIGFDQIQADVKITRYRKISSKGKALFHIVLNYTPFYAESGGQVGDKGYIEDISNTERIEILDTQKEHNVIVHICEVLPTNLYSNFKAVVNKTNRNLTASNHSATHLMHKALRDVLGNHVEQKGSQVDENRLRFDFAHFQKLTDEEIAKVEEIINEKIRKNILLDENRAVPIKEAQQMGAMALFGEKYGEVVRVIKFDDSIELCGGTHVTATGQIGMFKIISEKAIASGIRRIEAITSYEVEKLLNEQFTTFNQLKDIFKISKNITGAVEKLIDDNSKLNKEVENLRNELAGFLKQSIVSKKKEINGINIIAEKIEAGSAAIIKDITFQLRSQFSNLLIVLGAEIDGKANITVAVSDDLKSKFDAGKIIKAISPEIEGGGGGQAHYATAGGKKPEGIQNAIDKAIQFLKN